MKERINILCATDANYAPYHGVMLTSLFMNNKESQFDVYMLADETWLDRDTMRFEKLCQSFDSKFHLIKVDNSAIKHFPQRTHITLPTYYRILACDLLPQSVQKILLLDGDIIVRGDIRPIWNTNMDGVAFAGVIDSLHFEAETYSRLGYDRRYGYCNAGVSLYNFDYWRKNNISKQILEFIMLHQENLPFMDQDAINAILATKKKLLPIRYNLQTLYLMKYFSQNFTSDFFYDVVKNASNPIIIHYNGGAKPWQWRYYCLPYRKEWNEAYKASPWSCARQYKPFGKFIKHLIKRVFMGEKYKESCLNGYIEEAKNL